MVIPFMTIYCTQQLHFSITQAGLILGLFGLGSISGAFFGGKLTDKYGFYDVQVSALILGGMLFMLLGFQKTFLSLGTFTFILSLCNEAFRPANSTAIAYHSSPENKTRSYSLNRLAINLGWSFGGALGGLLASINYHLLFWMDGCTNILAAILLLVLLPRGGFTKAVTKATPDSVPSSAYKDKVYLAFIAMAVVYSICFFQLFTVQPLFYKTEWHLNERFIGALMALNGLLIVAFEMLIVNNLEGRKHPLRLITIGVLLTGVAFLSLNILPAGRWAGVVVMLLITLGEMMSMPFMNAFWIVRTSDNNRGQYAALYSMAWSTAQILAPTIGSQIILYGHFTLLWWILAGMCLVSATGFMAIYRFTSAKS